ncbi:MAG: hypothetical protein LC130_30585 [Bryobacterales bacterium]|nr:hypothetical protein [Bryobacterales bacterium]
MRVRASCGLLALVAILLLESPVAGQINDIDCEVVLEHRNPVMGEEARYTGTGPNPPGWVLGKCLWNTRLVFDPLCADPWVQTDMPGNPSISFMHVAPGSFEMKLDVWYSNFPQMRIEGPFHVEKAFAIAPANRIEIFKGLNVPTPIGTPITLSFQVFAGDIPIGVNTGALAQRRLTNRTQEPPLQPPNLPDTVWLPVPGTPPSGFTRLASYINETKTHDTWTWWDAQPVGAYQTETEHIRLWYTDSCQQEHIINLGSFVFQRVKVNDTQWMYTQVEN